MSVEHLEVLVEEQSMEEVLRLVLPKMIGDLSFEIRTYPGKQTLLSKLGPLLRGYAAWIPESYRILIVVDRDNEDCTALKARLEQEATQAGLATRSTARGKKITVINRIAVEELEAWYFGDWAAVERAYPRARRERFRDPDAIAGGTWEAFERTLQAAGYFKTGLRKIEAARAIGQHMAPDRNRSRSFQALRTALTSLQ